MRARRSTAPSTHPARTFLPPPEYNPLAPTRDALQPTEVPSGVWDVAVFDNRFPSLGGPPAPPPRHIVPTAPATGCVFQ